MWVHGKELIDFKEVLGGYSGIAQKLAEDRSDRKFRNDTLM